MLVGDFNMVKTWSDKSCHNASMIPNLERLLFDAMKTALNVDDNPLSAGSLRYSWDNNQRHGERDWIGYIFFDLHHPHQTGHYSNSALRVTSPDPITTPSI